MPARPIRVGAFVRRTAHLAAVSAPSFAGRGAQFLALAALAVLVPPAEYGRFAALQAVVLGLASIVGSTMGSSANALVARAVRQRGVGGVAVLTAVLHARRVPLLLNGAASTVAVPVGFFLITAERVTVPTLAVLALVGLLSGAVPIVETTVAAIAGSGYYARAAWLDASRAVAGAVAAVGVGVVAGPLWALVALLSADVIVAAVVLVLGRTGAPRVELHPREARDGLAAGLTANVVGQVANWIVLWAVQVVAGPVGLGVYGVAVRFASVVTLAPQYFGKTVIGQLAVPDPKRNHWTPRSFIGMLAVLSIVGSAVAMLVMLVGFPQLVARYPGVQLVLAAVLLATSFRAVLIGLGHVCVARRQWRVWVVADLTSLAVTVLGVGTVLVLHEPGQSALVAVVIVVATANLAGVLSRLVGVRHDVVLPTAGRRA